MDYRDVSVRPVSSQEELRGVIALCKQACEEFRFDYGDFFEKYSGSLWWGLYIEGKMIGAIRVIIQSSEGLPVYAEDGWPELAGSMPPDSCELAMVAVKKEYRGLRYLFLPMYTAFYCWCIEHGVEHVYAILNKSIWLLYRRIGIVFEKCGEEKVYWNDPSFPAHLQISALTAYAKEHRPELWAMAQAYATTGSFAPGP